MTDQLLDKQVRQFLDELASGSATPGGGSVAALAGAMAAGLITMVCDLTIGKKAYADFEEQARQLRERAEALRAELQDLAQEDIEAFNRVMVAYQLPRTTEADAANRRASIEKVTKYATEVPIRTARAIVGLLPLCAPLARYGNRTVLSDIGAAALLIKAAAPAALLNVENNVRILEDQIFVREARAQAEDLTMGLDEEVAAVLAIIRERTAS